MEMNASIMLLFGARISSSKSEHECLIFYVHWKLRLREMYA